MALIRAVAIGWVFLTLFCWLTELQGFGFHVNLPSPVKVLKDSAELNMLILFVYKTDRSFLVLLALFSNVMLFRLPTRVRESKTILTQYRQGNSTAESGTSLAFAL